MKLTRMGQILINKAVIHLIALKLKNALLPVVLKTRENTAL